MSFSKVFQFIKHTFKVTLSHLVLFTRLIENEVLKEVNFGSIIDDFASIKANKGKLL